MSCKVFIAVGHVEFMESGMIVEWWVALVQDLSARVQGGPWSEKITYDI